MKQVYIVLACVVLGLSICFRGECQDLKSDIDGYFSDFKVNRLNTAALSRINRLPDNSSILGYLAVYQNDSMPNVRAEAYRLIGNLSSAGANRKEGSQKYIRALLQGLKDRSLPVNLSAIRYLTLFKPTYFEKENVSTILSATRRVPVKGDFFKLLGFIGSSAVLDTLKSYEIVGMSTEERWALKLALARIGDSTSISFVCSVFDNTTKNSNDFIRLLPDFSYTKNRQVIGKMLKLTVDDKLRCRSQNPSSEEQIPCSYYIIPYLCYSIANFPVEVDGFGELVDDYRDAMQKIAVWEKTKGETYLIQAYSYK